MGETASKEKAPKKDFVKNLKAEFNKIIWPDKEELTKQTVVVVITTVVLGFAIAALDLIIKFGLNIVIG
jgi:preprotein translocase subunit SecE